MSKIPMPYCVEDVSDLARSLRGQLEKLERTPTHLEMLNLLAKAGGFRNFQHFRAQREALSGIGLPQAPPEVDHKRIKRVVRLFDHEGALVRWPKKFSERMICLWVVWSRVSARKTYTEREINELIERQHRFGDYALLRREMVDRGLLARTPDGREYHRVEAQPTPEAVEAIRLTRTH